MTTPAPVPFNRMNVLDVLVVFRDVINVMDAAGLIVKGDDGHYDLKATASQIEALVPQVETLIEEHGVAIPTQVGKVIAALPLVLSLIGVN